MEKAARYWRKRRYRRLNKYKNIVVVSLAWLVATGLLAYLFVNLLMLLAKR